MLLVFDAGHGGTDAGAIGYGIKEKDVVLKLARLTRDYMIKNYNVAIEMTRDSDIFVGLTQRASYANGKIADYFVSFHNNAFNTQANGFETFVWSGGVGQDTLQKQTIIHDEIMGYLKQYGTFDRGKKTADYAVLRETNMGAILIEFLFIDQQSENYLLKDEQFLVGLSKVTGDAIAKSMRLTKVTASVPEPKPAPSYEIVKALLDGQPIRGYECGVIVNDRTHLIWTVLDVLGLKYDFKGNGLFVVDGKPVQGFVYNGDTYLPWYLLGVPMQPEAIEGGYNFCTVKKEQPKPEVTTPTVPEPTVEVKIPEIPQIEEPVVDEQTRTFINRLSEFLIKLLGDMIGRKK